MCTDLSTSLSSISSTSTSTPSPLFADDEGRFPAPPAAPAPPMPAATPAALSSSLLRSAFHTSACRRSGDSVSATDAALDPPPPSRSAKPPSFAGEAPLLPLPSLFESRAAEDDDGGGVPRESSHGSMLLRPSVVVGRSKFSGA